MQQDRNEKDPPVQGVFGVEFLVPRVLKQTFCESSSHAAAREENKKKREDVCDTEDVNQLSC